MCMGVNDRRRRQLARGSEERGLERKILIILVLVFERVGVHAFSNSAVIDRPSMDQQVAYL